VRGYRRNEGGSLQGGQHCTGLIESFNQFQHLRLGWQRADSDPSSVHRATGKASGKILAVTLVSACSFPHLVSVGKCLSQTVMLVNILSYGCEMIALGVTRGIGILPVTQTDIPAYQPHLKLL
jgi:hypothetical protein